ncbi:Uncharacterised protein [Mycobacterium tuberculosis]|nr:Uncharacterised protein [Mycobacterium tuberculosis]
MNRSESMSMRASRRAIFSRFSPVTPAPLRHLVIAGTLTPTTRAMSRQAKP